MTARRTTPREHGTRAKYCIDKCRCVPCRLANRAYERERERKRARVRYGIEPHVPAYVDATPAREHLLWLRSVGVGRITVHQRTGIATATLADIASGEHRRVKRETEAKILAVGKFDRPKGTRVDGRHALALIEDLLYLGFTKVAISTAVLGRPSLSLQLPKSGQMTLRRIAAIERAYDQLTATLPEWHGTYAGSRKHHCKCRRCRARAAEYARERRAS